MHAEHNSREKFYRSPFGAVRCSTEIKLRLALSNAGIPGAVRLVIREDSSETEQCVDMAFVFTVGENSIYEADVRMPEKSCLMWYYFEVEVGDITVYYGNNMRQMGGMGESFDKKPANLFQITVYEKDYKTPDWFKNGIAYQIFPDRFFNGNEDGSFLGDRTDIIKRNWGDIPYYKAEQFGGEYLSNDFFGGNLKGIIKKLPYLEDLGISVIYLNPIFKAYSNHKYDTGSYEEIDPMFGDEKTFKKLCDEAEKRGIKIILDGVFNHTGSDSMYFNKNGTYDSIGAYQSQESPYFGWYKFIKWPEEYESWWGMTTLPHCDENCEDYRKYIISDKNSIIKRWLRNGASGWRLDVVDELPGFFVKELRKSVKEEKKDAVIIGEVWEDASHKSSYGERREYFRGKELDSVMNYPMRDAMIDFMLGKIDAYGFDERLMSLKENYPEPAYYSLLNMLSSHDVERFLTLMGEAPSRHMVGRDYQVEFNLSGTALERAVKRTKLAYGLQMLLPGVPCIYYGDEILMQGYGDPFCRATFPWDGITESGEKMREYLKRLIELRKSSDAFLCGDFESVYKIGGVYAFMRYSGNEKYLVAVNIGHEDKVRVDTARFGVTVLNGINTDERHKAQNSIFYINMGQYEMKIFRADKI